MTIDPLSSTASAAAIAAAVRGGQVSAHEVTEAALTRIGASDTVVNAFTDVTADRARAEAAAVDRDRAAGLPLGPLAGVPVAYKNLFDVAGITTLAGSRIHAEHAPAAVDATVVRRLVEAGAITVGALNMDEYAYGFTTENSHVGPCRNPHDPSRISGGSSGGSGAAVAAGQVPVTFGSDTNGSIRVPSSLCGVFGLKPTYGRVPRTGTTLFAASLDHLGPLARHVADLALAFDVVAGADGTDPVCGPDPAVSTSRWVDDGIAGLRIARLGGYFARGGEPEAFHAVDRVCDALGVHDEVVLPEVERARAAAMIITAVEGAQAHEADLRSRAADFDPMTRDRFLAGLLVPAAHYVAAQRFRAWWRDEVRRALRDWDVVLAPSTPTVAKPIGQTFVEIDGVTMRAAPHQGIFTQPLSFVGLPVVSVPVYGAHPALPHLPIGVQVVARPFDEIAALRVAATLEALGVATAPVAPQFVEVAG